MKLLQKEIKVFSKSNQYKFEKLKCEIDLQILRSKESNLIGLISNFKKDHPDSEFAWQNSKFNDLKTVEKQIKHEKYNFGGFKCFKKAKLNVLAERKVSLEDCLVDFEPKRLEVQEITDYNGVTKIIHKEKPSNEARNYKVYNTPGFIKVLSRMIL